MPSVEAYVSERTKRLESFPECAANYARFQDSSRREPKPDYLPIKLDIENVSRCNFRCVMCQVSEWENGKRARDLQFHEFEQIINENVGLLEIKIQGMGEPTMGRDDFFSMIRFARERFIWVRTVTNGSLLHQNDNISKFLQSGVNEIQISIDGATQETFEKIRRGGKFRRVTENVKQLNVEARKLDLSITKMWTVVQNQNINELESLVELASALGFSSQVFSLDIVDWGNSNWTDRNSEISVNQLFTLERANTLYELGKRLGVKVAFWNINQKYEYGVNAKLCPWPFERSYIGSDSRVVPCCMVADPDTFEIKGGKTFVEIWKSKNYSDFRQSHLDGSVPKICKNCYKN